MKIIGGRILVIGGVHRLGRVISRDLAGRGAAIAISSRYADSRLKDAVAALVAEGAPATAGIAGDVRTRAGASALVSAASDALGGLDAVVFCASGPFRPAAPEDIEESDWDASLDTIAKGFFFATCAARESFLGKAVAPSGRTSAGVIVALTDCMGLQPWAAFAAHGAAKAAQIHLVKQLARAWAPEGIRVCGVAPGPVALDDDEHPAATMRAADRGWERLVSADAVAAAVRFCLETEGVTGSNVIVDNGSLLTS